MQLGVGRQGPFLDPFPVVLETFGRDGDADLARAHFGPKYNFLEDNNRGLVSVRGKGQMN